VKLHDKTKIAIARARNFVKKKSSTAAVKKEYGTIMVIQNYNSHHNQPWKFFDFGHHR